MTQFLDPALALLTVALGAFGLIAPRFTLSALDLRTQGSNMGLSEMRASVGGLFVALGGGALVTGSSALYAALGLAYAGAAAGRGLSLVLDAPPLRKAGFYFAVEAVLAGLLLRGGI